ncbi:MAG: cytochrome P450 [Actinomycetota bacterium]
MTDRLYDEDTVADPCPYFAGLRAREPVHEVDGSGVFLVTRMDLVKQIVNDPETFSNHYVGFLQRDDDGTSFVLPLGPAESDPSVGWVLATADPPDHARHRRVLQPYLTPSAVEAHVPVMRGFATELLAPGVATGRMDWMRACAEPLPMRVLARLLDLPDAAIPQMLAFGDASGERLSGLASRARLAELDQIAFGAAGAFVLDAYVGRGRDATDSLVGSVVAAVESGALAEREALAMLAVVVIAGGESTTGLLGNAVHLLAVHPDVQDRLRADPALVPTFIEEAARLEPSFRNHPRVATRDTELAGVPIPAGAHLALVWPAANRDPAAFTAPDSIDLHRPSPRSHVTFGWGIHLCIGAPLARAEARVAVETLLGATDRVEIDHDAPPPEYVPSLMVRRLRTLPLRTA